MNSETKKLIKDLIKRKRALDQERELVDQDIDSVSRATNPRIKSEEIQHETDAVRESVSRFRKRQAVAKTMIESAIEKGEHVEIPLRIYEEWRDQQNHVGHFSVEDCDAVVPLEGKE